MARMMHFYFSRDSKYDIVAFTVNEKYIQESMFCGLNVIAFESIEKNFSPEEYDLFIAIGPSKMNSLREMKYYEAKQKGYSLATYISPHAICESPLGENSFVGDSAIINSFSTIGFNNIFWEFCLVNNDSCIGNNCYFSPKSVISTFSNIGDNTIIGTGSIVKTSVIVAEKTLIGAGCYISKDTEVKGVYGEKSSPLYGCISDKIQLSI